MILLELCDKGTIILLAVIIKLITTKDINFQYSRFFFVGKQSNNSQSAYVTIL